MNTWSFTTRPRLSVRVLGVPLLAFGLLTACNNQGNAEARRQAEQEVAQLRESNQELQKLQAENQEITRLRKDEAELKRLREQSQDLGRLRETNLQLRSELQALKAPKPRP